VFDASSNTFLANISVSEGADRCSPESIRGCAPFQLTWFRAQKNLEWIELKPDESLEKCAVTFLSRYGSRKS
jgi:tRNA A37 N6-isopentenylltransferase MiaA